MVGFLPPFIFIAVAVIVAIEITTSIHSLLDRGRY